MWNVIWGLFVYYFVRYDVLSFGVVNIVFYKNIRWKILYWEIYMFYEVWVLKIKWYFISKMLIREMFYGCLISKYN